MLAPAGTYAVIGYGGTVSAPSGALVGQEQSVVANLVGRWTDLWELIAAARRRDACCGRRPTR